ncbi:MULTISPECIES: DUF4328 domain-containing protein [unclassified Streptomyces]|uniref:DUF4328 domain-containing protein n=1 Tax=unclassified Streptomyces TaxID=2593676 RepID=UPI000DB9A3DC|nr:DUF4328 domain-containing protein [Streptomyces sp. PsTaAH-137]MYT73528.1 DUF4328 domain-containing protein [Streptomyces sp. SID8367]RAJ85064.1 uncharacterized protein DUF4328 [Streptomyces sp. PsTaAH-137]
MLCKKCGKNQALVEDGLCSRCAAAVVAELTPAPGPDLVADAPLPPRAPSTPYDPEARWALLRSPNGLATLAVALLCLVAAADLAAILAGVGEYRILADAAGGDWSRLDDADARRVDELYVWSGRIQLLTLAASAAGFIAWFLRVRDNAHVFVPSGQSKARAWAIFGFFVPVVSLWFPRRIALDTWHASSAELELGRGRAWMVDLWWFLWLGDLLIGRIAGNLYDSAETLDEITSATGLVIFADALDIVAAGTAVAFVRALTGMQNRKVQARTASLATAADGLSPH